MQAAHRVLSIMVKILSLKNKLKRALNKLSEGFTLIEVLIGVSLFTVFMTSIVWGYITLVKLEIKSKQKIYEHQGKINSLSEKYYIGKE
jgi:prepilin-type N-terminal cleavage/methylation domain-containing protein